MESFPEEDKQVILSEIQRLREAIDDGRGRSSESLFCSSEESDLEECEDDSYGKNWHLLTLLLFFFLYISKEYGMEVSDKWYEEQQNSGGKDEGNGSGPSSKNPEMFWRMG